MYVCAIVISRDEKCQNDASFYFVIKAWNMKKHAYAIVSPCFVLFRFVLFVLFVFFSSKF